MSSLSNLIRTSSARKLYELMPRPVRNIYRRIVHFPSHLTWRVHPAGKARTDDRLVMQRDRFIGHRAILLGNGPSLRQTDFDLLTGEFVIGTNRVYLMARETGLSIALFVCVNHLVLEQFHHEIRNFDIRMKLIDWRNGHRWLADDPRAVFLPELPTKGFRRDISRGWNHGYTVTFAGLQAAYYLGFHEVFLLGVDHRFRTEGISMRETVADGPDPDHFSEDYFGRGIRWHLPNLEGSEASYREARRAFEQDGRRIVDATVGGALQVFPKISLETGLRESSAPQAVWKGSR